MWPTLIGNPGAGHRRETIRILPDLLRLLAV
jgi:hypothetical protein